MDNAMKDKRCPKCAQTKQILAEGKLWVMLTEAGTDPVHPMATKRGGLVTGEYDNAACPACGFAGKMHHFVMANQHTCRKCQKVVPASERRAHLLTHSDGAVGVSDSVLDNAFFIGTGE